MSNAGGFLQGHSTTAISAHTVLVLDPHDTLTEVALVHIKVEAVHGNQLSESNVVGLTRLLSQCITEDEHALLGGVRV